MEWGAGEGGGVGLRMGGGMEVMDGKGERVGATMGWEWQGVI